MLLSPTSLSDASTCCDGYEGGEQAVLVLGLKQAGSG